MYNIGAMSCTRTIECVGHVNILMTEANAKCEPFVPPKELSAQKILS